MGEFLEEIFVFLLMIYRFILLSFLDNTPQIVLGQMLFSFPVIVSLSKQTYWEFMWPFFFLSNAHIIESYLWTWTYQTYSHPWSLSSHLYKSEWDLNKKSEQETLVSALYEFPTKGKVWHLRKRKFWIFSYMTIGEIAIWIQ